MTKTKKSPASPKHLFVNTQKCILISSESVTQVVEFLLKKTGFEEMVVYFVGKKKIASLHAQFFDDPSSTDCISFPYEDPHFLGEVFVCPQVAKDYVAENGGDLYDEITLYLVHGFCHLLGFDDQTPSDREEMRKQEKKWLNALAKNHLRVTG